MASSARVRASMIKDVGGSGSGSDGDEGDALVNVTGSAVIGEAWEPKPFFLGTWLSQVLDICPFLVQAPRPPVWAILGDKEGALCGDEVALEGMELKLGGQSLVRGNVSLAGSAVVQVNPISPLFFFRRKIRYSSSLANQRSRSSGISDSFESARLCLL